MTINSDTRIVALLGDPVSHSLSPQIHNRAIAELGLNLAYFAFCVKAEALADAVKALRTFGFVGANVTLPHKEDVIFFLDRLTHRAEQVGAVNTIICDESEGELQLVGDNTDVGGFLLALEPHRDHLAGKEALVWGSGGSARAVVYALLEELNVSRVHLVCRSREKGEKMAELIDPVKKRIDVVNWDYAALPIQQSAILVNTTPIGMTPDVSSSPCSSPELLQAGQIVYDLVYNPVKTKLLQQADAVDAISIGGLNMLLGQAAESFKEWTGKEFPLSDVRSHLSDLPT